jgi:hypothetical protein
MRRKTHRLRRQVMLFPAVAKGETAPAQARGEIVRALADLLLEALRVETDVEGGGDEHEPEDHA